MSASIDALIAQLNLTITHPNPSPPPATLPGSAYGTDQASIRSMIDQLRVADAINDSAISSASGATAAAAAAVAANNQASSDFAANLTAAFNAWDRSVRALETLIVAASPAGFVFSPPINPAIHISTLNVFAAQVRSGTAVEIAKPLNISADIIAAAKAAPAAYLSLVQSGAPALDPQPARNATIASLHAGSTQAQLSQLITLAVQYLSYLGIT